MRNSFVLLSLLLVLVCIHAQYYDVSSDCDMTACPKTTSEIKTVMECPKNGTKEGLISFDSDQNVELALNTSNLWPVPSSKVIIKFSWTKNWNQNLNVILVGTYSSAYYFYILPCNVSFTQTQLKNYSYYCMSGRTWDSSRIVITKVYFDSTESLVAIDSCNFSIVPYLEKKKFLSNY